MNNIFLNFFDDLKLSFGIIAISETWTDSNLTDDYSLSGYNVFHIVRQQKRRGCQSNMAIKYSLAHFEQCNPRC